MTGFAIRRGDVVVAAYSGDYGKPRPSVVVQSDDFNRTHDSVVLCPITSELTGLTVFRVPLESSDASGLRVDSEAMVDKMAVVKRVRIRQRVGRLTSAQMADINAALRVWLDLQS